MERTLHRQLKHWYAEGGQVEVTVDGFRIDAIRGDELVEVQCSTLASIRNKIARLADRHPVRIVKPIVHRTRIEKRKTIRSSAASSVRWSPKKGDPREIFSELVSIAKWIGHPNVRIELPVVDVLQIRVPPGCRRGRRRKPFRVLDTSLLEIHRTLELADRRDVWNLIGVEPLDVAFNTQSLAEAAGCCRWRAQQMAYVLRHCGAVQTIGRTRAGHQYLAVA